ncbi:MAG: preprotein translocase subunit YajC [Eubacteriales bacterium]
MFERLLDAADSATKTASGIGSWYSIIMIVVLVAVMYFFMIRPQRKQEKETNAMRNALQVGDEITTIGGIIGKIVSIKDETCMIETGHDRTKIRILKSAVRCVDVKAEDAQN